MSSFYKLLHFIFLLKCLFSIFFWLNKLEEFILNKSNSFEKKFERKSLTEAALTKFMAQKQNGKIRSHHKTKML